MKGVARVLLGALALGRIVPGSVAPAWAADPAVALGAAQALIVTADRVVIEDGVAHGDGHVALKLGGQALAAARFRLDAESGTLVLEEGTWERPEGPVVFGTASIDLGDASGTLVRARQTERDGRWQVSAGTLTW